MNPAFFSGRSIDLRSPVFGFTEIATTPGIALHDHIIVGRNGHASMNAMKLV